MSAMKELIDEIIINSANSWFNGESFGEIKVDEIRAYEEDGVYHVECYGSAEYDLKTFFNKEYNFFPEVKKALKEADEKDFDRIVKEQLKVLEDKENEFVEFMTDMVAEQLDLMEDDFQTIILNDTIIISVDSSEAEVSLSELMDEVVGGTIISVADYNINVSVKNLNEDTLRNVI